MAKAGVVSAACYCAAGSLFYSRHWPNHRASAVVFCSAHGCWRSVLRLPFDNHKSAVLKRCAPRCARTAEGGEYAIWRARSLFTMIPVLNLFIMPVAVCGAGGNVELIAGVLNALWK